MRGVRTLIVASNGPLASLPLAALVTDAPGTEPTAWLVRRSAVVQLPSPSALLALRPLPPGLTLGPQSTSMVFHNRYAQHAAHRWLRGLVLATCTPSR